MMRHRGGYSLIEMLAVVGASSLILAAIAGLLTLLLRVEAAARKDAEAIADAQRLAEQFRLDCRTAEGIDIAEDDGSTEYWELTLSGGQMVSYFVGPEEVTRAVEDESEFESYCFPGGISASIELPDENSQRVVRLRLAWDYSAQGGAHRTHWAIEAAMPAGASERIAHEANK